MACRERFRPLAQLAVTLKRFGRKTGLFEANANHPDSGLQPTPSAASIF